MAFLFFYCFELATNDSFSLSISYVRRQVNQEISIYTGLTCSWILASVCWGQKVGGKNAQPTKLPIFPSIYVRERTLV